MNDVSAGVVRVVLSGAMAVAFTAILNFAAVFAFTPPMASETLPASVLRGQSVGEWAQELGTPLEMVGLAWQIGFAVAPVLRRRKATA